MRSNIIFIPLFLLTFTTGLYSPIEAAADHQQRESFQHEKLDKQTKKAINILDGLTNEIDMFNLPKDQSLKVKEDKPNQHTHKVVTVPTKNDTRSEQAQPIATNVKLSNNSSISERKEAKSEQSAISNQLQAPNPNLSQNNKLDKLNNETSLEHAQAQLQMKDDNDKVEEDKYQDTAFKQIKKSIKAPTHDECVNVSSAISKSAQIVHVNDNNNAKSKLAQFQFKMNETAFNRGNKTKDNQDKEIFTYSSGRQVEGDKTKGRLSSILLNNSSVIISIIGLIGGAGILLCIWYLLGIVDIGKVIKNTGKNIRQKQLYLTQKALTPLDEMPKSGFYSYFSHDISARKASAALQSTVIDNQYIGGIHPK